jgi:phosphomevalonate kinase
LEVEFQEVCPLLSRPNNSDEYTYFLSQIAGGYDAIWLLVCDPISCEPDQTPLERVERIWSNYKELSVSPLSSKESLAKGIRLESIDDIPGFAAALS